MGQEAICHSYSVNFSCPRRSSGCCTSVLCNTFFVMILYVVLVTMLLFCRINNNNNNNRAHTHTHALNLKRSGIRSHVPLHFYTVAYWGIQYTPNTKCWICSNIELRALRTGQGDKIRVFIPWRKWLIQIIILFILFFHRNTTGVSEESLKEFSMMFK